MKKMIIFLGILLTVSFLLSACRLGSKETLSAAVSSETSPEDMKEETVGMEEAYHKITAEEAKKMMDEGGVTVVDVRRAEEYEEKHIPGALLVPVESIGKEPPETLPDKEAVLLLHCRTGIRSKQASDKLIELGYTKVYDFGGIVDWSYETESGSAK